MNLQTVFISIMTRRTKAERGDEAVTRAALKKVKNDFSMAASYATFELWGDCPQAFQAHLKWIGGKEEGSE